MMLARCIRRDLSTSPILAQNLIMFSMKMLCDTKIANFLTTYLDVIPPDTLQSNMIDPSECLRKYLESATEAGIEPDGLGFIRSVNIHAPQYPLLRQLAQIYFSVQASSVPSERLFSNAGNTVTKLRNSLSPSTIEDLCFVTKHTR